MPISSQAQGPGGRSGLVVFLHARVGCLAEGIIDFAKGYIDLMHFGTFLLALAAAATLSPKAPSLHRLARFTWEIVTEVGVAK